MMVAILGLRALRSPSDERVEYSPARGPRRDRPAPLHAPPRAGPCGPRAGLYSTVWRSREALLVAAGAIEPPFAPSAAAPRAQGYLAPGGPRVAAAIAAAPKRRA